MNTYKVYFLLILSSLTGYKSFAQEGLKEKIKLLDSIFFHAYNNCDTLTQNKMYDDSVQFYHDINGITNSKKEIIASTIKFICGKVERQLVEGSIEVYPIKDYGAIEMGEHRFINKEEGSISPPYKFIIFWKNQNNQWTLEKIVSLHKK